MVRNKIKRIYLYLLLILISVIPLIDLLHPGLPVTHDGQDHVVRIANFYESLTEGILIPRWAGHLNWGYGHPILMFLYPLPSYAASVIHVIGFSFVDSTKLVFGISFIASMLCMYLWLSCLFGKKAGFVGALLYGFAPYRFVDLYVRGALGEHIAFIFPPLICYFLRKLALGSIEKPVWGRTYTYCIGLSLSIAALILSHNAISLMFIPITVSYAIYLFFFESKKSVLFIGYCLLSAVFGFLLPAFFWVPAVAEGKYTLRDIVTKGEYAKHFVDWKSFFISPWSYGGSEELSKAFGLIQWIGIFISGAVFFFRKNLKEKVFTGGIFVLLFMTMYLMTSFSEPVIRIFTVLEKFQFPWRFMSVVVFLSAVLGSVSFAYVCNKIPDKKYRGKRLLIAYCLLLTASTVGMWHAKTYRVRPVTFYTGVYAGTTDTGESSPIWSIRFMEKKPKFAAEVVEGKGIIVPGIRTSTLHTYEVQAESPVRFLENTLYFPGWDVIVDGRPLDRIRELIYMDPLYRGLMTFELSAGRHSITVQFKDTRLRSVANTLSLGGIGLLAIFYLVGRTVTIKWEKEPSTRL